MNIDQFERAQEIFLDAVERPLEEREAFARERCGDDVELRGIILDLLRTDMTSENEAEARILEGVRELLSQEQPPISENTAALLQRLGEHAPMKSRYTRMGEAGRGGMGVVLRVWDEDLRRTVAMKVAQGLTPGAGPADESTHRSSLLSRFLEEAQVNGQLDHPGIVPVHELGIDAEGEVYFTMRLVKGRTLAEILFDFVKHERDGWTRTRALGVILKVCEAMSYAHSKGVIHRDLKLQNIMVGRFGEVYVMDWGVAKVLGKEETRDLRIKNFSETARLTTERAVGAGPSPSTPLTTMDGMVIGTPSYMPPEQARGDVEAIDARTDVYAVGAMLYCLLTGQPPYVPPGSRLPGHTILCSVLSGPPESVRTLTKDVPAELEAICEKAMARESAARYEDMRGLADDLRAYIEGRVVLAHETGALAEARKWIGRNKPLAASLAAVIFLAVGGSSGIAYVQAAGKRAADVQRGIAQANEKEARDQAARAERERLNVLRLSVFQKLEDLQNEAAELWPARPASIDAYEDWLLRAGDLISYGADDELFNQVSRLRARGSRVVTAQGETWRFADDQDRWWHNQLLKLVGEIRAFANEKTGLVTGTTQEHGQGVSIRLALARSMRSKYEPGGEYHRRWAAAREAIAARYEGLDLSTQVGLVPIGPDPTSGLWEFWHVPSGEEPARGSDGRLVMEEVSGLVLVLVPGGTFMMGAQSSEPDAPNYDPSALPNEGPVHEVSLSPFFLSKYEMTQGQWQRAVGKNPSYHQGVPIAPTLLHPVEQVSWLDCNAVLPRLGLTLPSEAQWEYAARAGTDTVWWTGQDRDSLRRLGAANLADRAATRAGYGWTEIHDWPELDDGWAVHSPVGTHAANPFGLHEVHGNVWEWCLDGFDESFFVKSPRQDPVAPQESSRGRASRGGSFYSTATGARSAKRALRVDNAPTSTGINIGVRPARRLDP